MSTYWTKKDGTKIRIRDMDDGHLANTIAMLERKSYHVFNEVFMNPPYFQGEMAQMQAEREWESMLGNVEEPGYIFPIYNDLVVERERRAKAAKKAGVL